MRSETVSRIGCSARIARIAYSSSEAAASVDTPTEPRHKEDSCAGEEVVKVGALKKAHKTRFAGFLASPWGFHMNGYQTHKNHFDY